MATRSPLLKTSKNAPYPRWKWLLSSLIFHVQILLLVTRVSANPFPIPAEDDPRSGVARMGKPEGSNRHGLAREGGGDDGWKGHWVDLTDSCSRPKVKCKATSDDTSGKFGSSADDKAFETVYCATGCDFVSRGHRGTTCRARKVEKGIKNVTTTAATAGFGERGVEDEEHRLSLRGDVDQLVIKRDKTYEVEEAFFFLCCFDRNGRDRSWEAAKSAFFELRTCSAVP